MNWWTGIWQYTLALTGSLGQTTVLAISISALAAVVGLLAFLQRTEYAREESTPTRDWGETA